MGRYKIEVEIECGERTCEEEVRRWVLYACRLLCDGHKCGAFGLLKSTGSPSGPMHERHPRCIAEARPVDTEEG